MNPVSEIKSNLSVSKILGFVVVGLAVFALLDFLNFTDYLLYPVTTLKSKFSKGGG